MISGGFEGNLIYCRLKFWRQSRQNAHNGRAKLAVFYCGYLLNKDSVAAEYAAPQITAITEGIVKGTEQRLSRALFKVAVELGAVSHMLAAVHEIDDDTMIKLRTMCTDEVKRINGIINFEKAVRYQRN